MAPLHYPPELPISARREEIVAALRAHQVLIIAGETGSGKTTQLPKMCLEAGLAAHGRIGCTQPRRVAALSISRRVAEELGVTWGREVGCKMRFNDDTSRETQVKFMTDGILLAEIQSDPLLRSYAALILDEAHERSLNIDFLLGYFPSLLRRRPELRLVITSATIDTEAFAGAFGGAPVVEVSGRSWPVEVRYRPLADAAPEDATYLDAAADAAEEALLESNDGDVLVFLPTERDLRETRDLLEERLGHGTEVLTLFGRMPAAEQQRIFHPGRQRRVIVATNIAETSLTLPRIRYVIDAGLARISRYHPRTRTKRLPVEEISQSSAQQRAGRAGRVQAGICVRLYSEEDFAERPRFTQPEIQRANLAEVILRLKAFYLGEIETFPFLNPPPAAAVRAGYELLRELGALTEIDELTAVGHGLARLPLDPTLGRMLLQALQEGVLPEVLVIAAGLSVPDPRERPEEQREAAATAHRAFADPDSDFLSLLNLWRASPEAHGRGSANALRRFCQANFLSFARMREWREIHAQLSTAVEDGPASSARDRTGSQAEPSYGAIHCSILTGLLGQVAQRQERNLYLASAGRRVTLFPGSSLHERPQPKRRSRGEETAPPEEKIRQAPWIIAGEIVETSQLFARTVASVNPEWVLELGAHLCRFRYTEPHWSAAAQRVLATERVFIHGLELLRRSVDYGRISPAEATELFLRGALVAEEGVMPHHFIAHNRQLREKLENALTRVRSRRAHDLEEALYRFYAARVENVSSVHDLNRLVTSRLPQEPQFLCASEEDLLGGTEAEYDRALFPDQVAVANSVLPLAYAYTPGEEADGVTVRVPLPMAAQLTSGQLQWMVPGLRAEQIGVLLRALPKAVRKMLRPLEPKIPEVAREFDPGPHDFLTALAQFLSRRYGVAVRAEDWPPNSLPPHLQPRVEVVDRAEKTVAAGRDLGVLQAHLKTQEWRSSGWQEAAARWEKTGLTEWSIGDVPEAIEVEQVGGVPLPAYPGLELKDDAVNLRLFRQAADAERASIAGLRRLAVLVLARDLARVRKELAVLARPASGGKKSAVAFQDALQQLGSRLPVASSAMSLEHLPEEACANLLAHALTPPQPFPLITARFLAWVEKVRRELPGQTYQLAEWTRQILSAREATLAWPKRYAGLEQDVQRLCPPDFLARTPYLQLPHLLRYLRALQVRADRAAVAPGKDAEKARQLLPFAQWEDRVPAARKQEFRWLLEEFRVSLFAQELGTAQPVSAQRLRTLGELS